MKNAACENQSRVLLLSGFLFCAAFVVVQYRFMSLYGFRATMVLVCLTIIFLSGHMGLGFLKSFATYSYDEELVTRQWFRQTRRMRWGDVVDILIRRSTGDSTIFLEEKGGAKLWLDFQLMGVHGAEMFETLSRVLRPIIERKTHEPETRDVRFRSVYLGYIPLPGSVAVGPENISSQSLSGKKTIPLRNISQIRVKEIRRLTPTQEYTVCGDGKEIQFRSSLENSPFLILYLKSKIPEDRWRVTKSSNVIMAKLLTAVMVFVLVWSSLTFLRGDASIIATRAALSRGAENARAEVLYVRQLSGRAYEIDYVFKTTKGDEVYGRCLIQASDKLPKEGSQIPILFSKEDPYLNQPEESPSVTPIKGLGFMDQLFLLVLSIPYLIIVLAFKPQEDPFLTWF